MRGWAITFDPAVGVVLGSGLGVQGVLVAGERAAVEAELVGVGNKSVVPLVFILSDLETCLWVLTQQPEHPGHTHSPH